MSETEVADIEETDDSPVAKQSTVIMNDGSKFVVNELITTVRRRCKNAKEKNEDFIIVRGPTGRLMFNLQLLSAVEEKKQ